MRVLPGLAALLVALVAGVVPANERPPSDDRLAPLARFAGEWQVDGKWSGGESLHARTVYEWGLGKKILKARTFVKKGNEEYQRYEGILAWHPKKKCLYEISFAFDGSISEYRLDAKDKDTLHIGWAPVAGSEMPRVRQTIHFTDDDHFQWLVQLRDGEGWKQLIDATSRRQGK